MKIYSAAHRRPIEVTHAEMEDAADAQLFRCLAEAVDGAVRSDGGQPVSWGDVNEHVGADDAASAMQGIGSQGWRVWRRRLGRRGQRRTIPGCGPAGGDGSGVTAAQLAK